MSSGHASKPPSSRGVVSRGSGNSRPRSSWSDVDRQEADRKLLESASAETYFSGRTDAPSLNGVDLQGLQYLQAQNIRQGEAIRLAKDRLNARRIGGQHNLSRQIDQQVKSIEEILHEDRHQRSRLQAQVQEVRNRAEIWKESISYGQDGELVTEGDRLASQVAQSTSILNQMRARREALQMATASKDRVVSFGYKEYLGKREVPVSELLGAKRPHDALYMHAPLERLQLLADDPTALARLQKITSLDYDADADELDRLRGAIPKFAHAGLEMHIQSVLNRRRESRLNHRGRMGELQERIKLLEQQNIEMRKSAKQAHSELVKTLAEQNERQRSLQQIDLSISHINASVNAHVSRLEDMREAQKIGVMGQYNIDDFTPKQLPAFWAVRPILDGILLDVLAALPSDKPANTVITDPEEIARLEQDAKKAELIKELSQRAGVGAIEAMLLAETAQEAADVVREVWAEEIWPANLAFQIILEGTQSALKDLDRFNSATSLKNLNLELHRKRRPKREAHVHSLHCTDRDHVDDAEVEIEDDGPPMQSIASVPFKAVSNELIDKENNYWPSVKFLPVFINTEFASGVELVVPSRSGWYMAVCPVQGGLYVYDLRHLPPILVRKSPNQDGGFVDIHWSFDSTTLVSLDRQSRVRVWSMKHPSGDQLVKDDGTFVPPPLALVATLPELQIKDGKSSLAVQELNQVVDTSQPDLLLPTSVAFHPSFTLLGTQPSVMVGIEGGVVLKQNTPDSAHVIHGEVLIPPGESEADAVESAAIGDPSKLKRMNTVSAMALDSKAANPVIPMQEYFVGHRARIIKIGSYRKTTTIVSLDADGVINVWPYESFAYTGFGWFEPSQTCKLNLDVETFAPKDDANIQCEFPPPELRVPELASQNSVFLEQSDIAADSFDSLVATGVLDPKPWHAELRNDGSTLSIFRPLGPSDPDFGDRFHTVIHDREGSLMRHELQTYMKTTKRGKIIEAELDDTGAFMYILVVYGAVPPREGQLFILKMDLRTMSLVPPKIEINIPKVISEEDVNNVDMAVSPRSPVTGVEHAFLVMGNLIYCISLESGKQVLPRPLRPLSHANLKASLHCVKVVGDTTSVVAVARDSPIVYLFDIEDTREWKDDDRGSRPSSAATAFYMNPDDPLDASGDAPPPDVAVITVAGAAEQSLEAKMQSRAFRAAQARKTTSRMVASGEASHP